MKLCVLSFDEMSIKESLLYNAERDEIEGLEDFGHIGKSRSVANHMTVFMLRGLLTKWKQPVAYYLSSGPIKSGILHSLLLYVLDKITDAGFNIKVVLADQGSNNRKSILF